MPVPRPGSFFLLFLFFHFSCCVRLLVLHSLGIVVVVLSVPPIYGQQQRQEDEKADGFEWYADYHCLREMLCDNMSKQGEVW